MKVCVPVAADGQVDPRWGRADRVAVAEVADGEVRDWQEFTVAWGTLHDQGTEGAHHARVARFLRGNWIGLRMPVVANVRWVVVRGQGCPSTRVRGSRGRSGRRG